MAVDFKYPALKPNEIRIAELLPSNNQSDPLHCQINAFTFNTSPPYSALSYTWGDAIGSTTKLQGITISNPDTEGVPNRQISITSNLDAALRRIRPKTGILTIWIDFLCIDQTNLPERSQQAGMMREIYQRAREVYVWLGEADESSPKAWKLMEDIVRGEGTVEETLRIVEDETRRGDFQALHRLFRRPYWTRIWVIQEVNSGGKSVTAYCGSQTLSWTLLEQVCDRLREVNKVLTAINPSDATLSNALMNGGPKKLTLSTYTSPENENNPSLFELLMTHQAKDSTDPKDKIYALVGISNSAAEFGTLDYTSSITSAYIRAAKHIISTTPHPNKLDVICLRQNDDIQYALPSWAPDWECRVSYPNHRKMGLHIRRPKFTASGDVEATYAFSETEGENALTVRGYVVDSIGEISIPFYMRGDEATPVKISKTLKTFETWWEVFKRVRGGNWEANEVEFTDTVYGGEWLAFTEPLPHDRRFEAFRALSRTNILQDANGVENGGHSQQQEETGTGTATGTNKDYSATISSASLRMHGKRFAISISPRKYACLAPLETQVGDLICVLFGCSFPVVLRRVEGGGRFVLVGEVYVSGVMWGETVLDAVRGNEVRDFVVV